MRALPALEDLEPLFKFFMHLSVRKSRENYRQIYGKPKASFWRNLSTDRPPQFFRTILCFVAIVYNCFFFFRTAVLRKLFDIRFSCKHCNFSHVCLPSRWRRKPWQGLLLPRTVVRSCTRDQHIFQPQVRSFIFENAFQEFLICILARYGQKNILSCQDISLL